jgi:hypothetical protein
MDSYHNIESLKNASFELYVKIFFNSTPLDLPQSFATPSPLHGDGVEFRYSKLQYFYKM